MRKRGYHLQAYQRCEYCADPLFSRQFYLFPCTHGFHSDCMLKRSRTQGHFEASQALAVSKLEEQIRTLRGKSLENDRRSQIQLEALLTELGSCSYLACVLLTKFSCPCSLRWLHRCGLSTVWTSDDSILKSTAFGFGNRRRN
jgi:hypothetical protein